MFITIVLSPSWIPPGTIPKRNVGFYGNSNKEILQNSCNIYELSLGLIFFGGRQILIKQEIGSYYQSLITISILALRKQMRIYWSVIKFYQFQLSSQSCRIQSYQSTTYSSSMNHLFCDRLYVIVHSQQFSGSQ